MFFKVINRDEAESINGIPLVDPYVMISISCPKDPANIPNRESCKDILRLEFDDVDVSVHLTGDRKIQYFNQEYAREILSFYRKYKDNIKYMIIHCDAGISRSPAVAAALSKIESGYDNDWFERYLPNRRVYSLLLSEFYSKE